MPTNAFYTISVYDGKNRFPDSVWATLRADAGAANLILPHAEKTFREFSTGNQFWITCTSPNSQEFDFILACTEGPLGPYPIFIYTPIPFRALNAGEYSRPIYLLAQTLHGKVPVTRVFSIFSVEPVTRMFAEAWTQLTNIGSIQEPYYKAKLTYCTNGSLIASQPSAHADLVFELRRATPDDKDAIAKLCYDFAKTSEPFVLTKVEALREAELMIAKKQVWVHTIQRVSGSQVEIASIVATTRQTDVASAISKVYTNDKWRRLGCAERLVRRVTKELLRGPNERVVLYVADDNPAASNVYDKVGFVGLSREGPPVQGVDTWLELGFDRSQVTLGHW